MAERFVAVWENGSPADTDERDAIASRCGALPVTDWTTHVVQRDDLPALYELDGQVAPALLPRVVVLWECQAERVPV